MNNVQQLRYAVEVERTGSITKAAENLYMGQPQLSKAIRQLEDQLGISIFRRTSRGVLPTSKGREFLSGARRILSQLDELEAAYRPAPDGRVTFDVAVPRASYASAAFADFASEVSGSGMLALDYRETDSVRAIENVTDGVNDIAVARYSEDYENSFLSSLAERDLRHEELLRFRRVALMSERHPLAKQPSVSAAELENYIEVVHGDLYVPALPVSRSSEAARAAHRRITVYERGSQYELLGRVESAYMWASPSPAGTLERFSLVQKPCSEPLPLWIDVLICRSGYRLTDGDRLFLSKLRERIAEISE